MPESDRPDRPDRADRADADPSGGPGRRLLLTGGLAAGAAVGGTVLGGSLLTGTASAAPARTAARGATTTTTASSAGHRPPIDIAAEAERRYGAEAPWFAANVPFVDLPDAAITDTWYYRWHAFTKHLRRTDVGTLITEFTPSVSWEGPNGTINAAVGHHLHEARWLHDRAPVQDELDWWLGGGGNLRQYSSWIGDSVWADALATGDTRLARAHLAGIRDNLQSWETNRDESKGLYWIAPTDDATEFTTTGLDVGDGWAGDAFRPTLNSYLYADHLAVSRIAALGGDTRLADTHAAAAAQLGARVQQALWHPGFAHFTDRFSDRYPDRYFTFASGPELAGFVPWYFGLPDASFDTCWRQLRDPAGFGGAHGLRTIRPDSPYYLVQHRTPGQIPGECEWNGPSWPFQTSQVLTGLARLLDTRATAAIGRDDYVALLHQYAAQQRKDGRPYVAEDLDPDTGRWIADFPDRSEDYNHSTFADLVVTGLLGVRPALDDPLRLRPLVPDSWDHFALQRLPYHGRVLDVVWDRSGAHYGGAAGLSVWVDGERVVSGAPLRATDVRITRRPVGTADRTVNYAYAPKGLGPAVATASSSAAGTSASDADDGRSWASAVPPNRWVSQLADRSPSWQVELPGTLEVTGLAALVLDDGAGVRAPSAWSVQVRRAGRWQDVPRSVLDAGLGRPPVANARLELDLARAGAGVGSVRADAVRLRLTPRPGAAVGLAELEVRGPRGQATTPRFRGVPTDRRLYQAEDARLRGTRAPAAEATASGGRYVGGIDGPDSGVTFTATSPDARRVRVGIRYANGTSDPATHRLTVNGEPAGVVHYPPTGGWGASGSWGITSAAVTVRAGANTVDLARGDGFAELDVAWVD